MRLTSRVSGIERRIAPARTSGCVVIYDAATGRPLPGHEPDPHAPTIIWIPDNGRAAVELSGDER